MNVLSIQSAVSYGHVGNSAAVFILQRLGHEAWPIDTVRFSNHPGHGGFRGRVDSRRRSGRADRGARRARLPRPRRCRAERLSGGRRSRPGGRRRGGAGARGQARCVVGARPGDRRSRPRVRAAGRAGVHPRCRGQAGRYPDAQRVRGRISDRHRADDSGGRPRRRQRAGRVRRPHARSGWWSRPASTCPTRRRGL